MIEANYGVFHDGNQCLLFQRQFQEPFKRSWYPGYWDLAGGDIPDKRKPLDIFVEDTNKKLGLILAIDLIEEGGTVSLNIDGTISKRHIFLYQLNHDVSIGLDSKKYADHKWCSLDDVERLVVVPGVREVLEFVGIFKS